MDAVATGHVPGPNCRRCVSTQRAWASIGCRDYGLDPLAAEPAGEWWLSDRTARRAPPAVHRAWLRALDFDLCESVHAALITVKKRRSAGAVKLFQDASRAVCREIFAAG